MSRKIIHIDMDAFFASVEQRDHPELKGKPVIVGGDPEKRGVVSTCSYEARKFGVHSAMPTRQAFQLCPDGIFVYPRFEVYKETSQIIQSIFHEYTPLVEPLSLDEAFLDVTTNSKEQPSATLLAQQIKQRIVDATDLTASAGVSYNKFLSKIASGWKKPNGLTVIPPKVAQPFIDQLPIRKFPGIGAVTEKKMLRKGIRTGYDLRQIELDTLIRWFGKSGKGYFQKSRGIDDSKVNPHRIRKSISKETTFEEDIADYNRLKDELTLLLDRLWKAMTKRNIQGRSITLKVRFTDFQTITRSRTFDHFIDRQLMRSEFLHLLDGTDAKFRSVRLLGVGISHFDPSNETTELEFPFDL